MRVWIDQKSCVGNGICEEICPEVFRLVDGAVAHVVDEDRLLPNGPAGTLQVPSNLSDSVNEAAEECPAACIYIEA
jgi:ferredoxin